MIYWMIKSNEKRIKKANTGSTVPHANRRYIEGMKMALPKDIKTLSNAFNVIQEQINHYRKEIIELSSMRDFLLPLLMNGQVTVKNKAK